MTMNGDESDWGWMDPSFATTRDQLTTPFGQSDVPKEDYDLVYFTGWSAPPDNQFYFFARITDDVLDINADDPEWWWSDDSIQLTFDPDHSGGNITGTEIAHTNNGQRYQIRIAPAPGQVLTETPFYLGGAGFQKKPWLSWSGTSPWSEIGWTALPEPKHGATNVTYTYEFRMALWDFYGESAGESTRHVFAPDQTIHFTAHFGDSDQVEGRNDNGYDPIYGLEGSKDAPTDSDKAIDHILVPGEAVTAVEQTTWGRIKSHMNSRLK
jgi:hypothetical protein